MSALTPKADIAGKFATLGSGYLNARHVGRREAVFLFRAMLCANVRFWHLTDNPTAPTFVRYWSNSGHWSALALNG